LVRIWAGRNDAFARFSAVLLGKLVDGAAIGPDALRADAGIRWHASRRVAAQKERRVNPQTSDCIASAILFGSLSSRTRGHVDDVITAPVVRLLANELVNGCFNKLMPLQSGKLHIASVSVTALHNSYRHIPPPFTPFRTIQAQGDHKVISTATNISRHSHQTTINTVSSILRTIFRTLDLFQSHRVVH
jgi:hypothetical protein